MKYANIYKEALWFIVRRALALIAMLYVFLA